MFKKLIGILVAIVEFLLITRFVMKFFSADPEVPAVAAVYQLTTPLISPFVSLFPTSSVRGGYQLEFTTVFAIFAFAFVGYLLQELAELLTKKSQPKSATREVESDTTI